jgi:hypothetical protein
MEKIEFLEAKSDLCTEIEAFFPKSDKGFYEYEYQGYLPEKSVFTVAISDKKIVGTQAVMPYRLNINNISMLTGRSERTLVDKTFRGGKIFPKLMHLCAEISGQKGVQFIWGFTNTDKPFKRQGFLYKHGYCEHALMSIRPLRYILSSIRKMEKTMWHSVVLIPSMLMRFLTYSISLFLLKKEKIKIQYQLSAENDFLKLYEKIRGDSNLVYLEQDNSFRTWLLDKTHRHYMTLFAYKEGELTSYVYIDLTDPHKAIIKDIASIDFISLLKIIQVARKELYKKNVAFLHAAYNFKNIPLKKLSRKLFFLGFIPVVRKGGFVVRPVNYIDMNILDDISAWYLTPVWSDLYKGNR